MNRLWVRLSLAFAAIIIISFGAISLTARRYFNDSNLRSLALSYFARPTGLMDLLETYYADNGSWQGVSPLLEGADSALFFNAANRTALILADPEGHVVYATAGTDRPDRLEASQLQQSLPISVEGRSVGFLDLVQREQPSDRLFAFSAPDDISPGFAERASEFLLQVLLLGGGTGDRLRHAGKSLALCAPHPSCRRDAGHRQARASVFGWPTRAVPKCGRCQIPSTRWLPR